MEDLISVIIPIFNSERYLRACIVSVLAQTYTCFEMILIDDGSSDRSVEICQRMSRHDERIRVIRQNHKGVSAARNRGLEAAKGKYVFFVDSDDIIHPQLLEALHRLMRERGVVGTQRRCRAEGERLEKLKKWRMEDTASLENTYLRNDEALECHTFVSPQTALSGIGGKMILADAVGSLRFEEKLTHAEDTLFMYQILAGGADVVVLCREWYCYRKHEKGTINKLTVRGCGSIYKVECFIRDQEMANCRKKNALLWEHAIINTMLRWYKAGWTSNDDELMKCLKNMEDAEKKQEIFSWLSPLKRLEFAMVTYSYSLYKRYKLSSN